MHQTQWSPERPLPPPVSLASQSHMRSPLRSPAQVEGTQGFLPQPGKDRKLLLRNQAYVTQELVEPLGCNRFARSPGHCISPRLGFLPQSLGSPLLQMTAPSAEWCSKKLGYVLGTRVRGKEKRRKPWVFLLAHSTLADNP